MIEVSHLTKEYGPFTAVDDISFELVPGEILGFLGPNGAGKSTTMKMLTGFLRPSAGTVRIWGCDMWKDSLTAQSRIGYLPEGAPAWEEMTPLGFLNFVGEARGVVAGRDLESSVSRAVSIMSLESVLHQKIETLSKGFKRRVGLAQAILHDPDVLILDEPTDGLDPNQKHQVREMIKGLSKDKIVIVSTHILEEVTAVCSRVMVLSEGRIVSDTTPAELLEKSDYHGAVAISLSDESKADEIVATLGQLVGVREVMTDGQQLVVFPVTDDGRLFPEVFELTQKSHWPVDSVHVEKGRLDEVFRRLTEGADR
ncbi:MAG: ATP-binding cassette domain-containing protein [Gammaproteobacteria bacterium]|jgi:ABC-2 type transport system ATP-binding protein|nr:ATP-binding cassette domain-containing protein [Gammaproteobacteria bacterium]MBT4492012.1 ATP-binding cassette domain-containing protein [Gammaproteobacteria bacterium]MBT7370979.1 ATP-binding cassette domain-containing protein [Gammaproteobacteria bacterium]